MKQVFMELIEHVLGNDKILIVLAIAFLCAYAIYTLPPELSSRLSDTAIGGLLGMAIGQRLSHPDELPAGGQPKP